MGFKAFWTALWPQLRKAQQARSLKRRAISDRLWRTTLAALPFVHALPRNDTARLRTLASLLLDRKEFSGAHGWVVTDAQAVMVATQACLPLLYIAPPDRPDLALRWYGGFVGIVLHASGVRARRTQVDAAGVVHSWHEDLSGEAMQGGPLMLAWSDVAAAGNTAQHSYNVVIHEFIHVMDTQDGVANGCPPMPAAQGRAWRAVMQAQYDGFCEQVAQQERFGGLAGSGDAAPPALQLNPYGSTHISEFFAVAAEAYFVQRHDFAAAYPLLLTQFDGFFRSHIQH